MEHSLPVSIPEEIRNKLIAKGFNSVTRLPNFEAAFDWQLLGQDCGLSIRELLALKKNMLPVQCKCSQ
jgi:hypothetical protein